MSSIYPKGRSMSRKSNPEIGEWTPR